MKNLRKIYAVGSVLAAICLVSAGVLVVLQIVGRLIGVLVPSVPELAGFLLGATIFLALADTQRLGEHIRVTVLFERVGPRIAYVLDVLYRVAGTVMLSCLTWYMVQLAYDSWEYNDKSGGMIGIPYWIPQSAMAFGVVLLSVRFVDELVQLLLRGELVEEVRPSSDGFGAS